MDKGFIDRVHNIVMANITNEKFGAANLASLIGLSTSQTLRKVRAITGKSVNQYIREVRLSIAAKLIEETDLTAAEIAYKVGFDSQSYFNKTFSRRYGITPGEYKIQNKTLSGLASKNPQKENSNIVSKKNALYLITIAMLFVVGYFIINNASFSKNESKKKSIAVLPFKDMSQENTQWFCDGVTDNILTNLSQINGLTVISRTSSNTYKGTNKKISEIAKELNVTFIIEGSVTIYDDKVKIIIQLINANDEHIWSKEYNDNFEDIFTIQQNVAKQIAEQLKINLSLEVEKQIVYISTDNLEAYELFLKGKSIINHNSPEDKDRGIDLIKRSIALDSSFAEAYEEVAFALSYSMIGMDLNKANKYVNKALKLNPQLARAYTTKGLILHWENERTKAGEYFNKAVKLNPNDPRAHHLLAVYYNSFEESKDIEKSFYHIKMARKLDPFSEMILYREMGILVDNNKLDEAETIYDESSYLFGNEFITFLDNYFLKARIKLEALNKKDWTVAIKGFHNAIEKDSTNSFLFYELGHAYNDILNEDINYAKYCKLAYEMDSTVWVNANSYYYSLVWSKKFNEANELSQNENFKSFFNERQKLKQLFYYHYRNENFKKTQKILLDSLMSKSFLERAINFAQLGDKENLNKILKKDVLINVDKAFIFAILNEKDSMYFYMEGEKDIFHIKHINSRFEFDPYRKEERYKAFLKKNYLPITHWNE